MRNEQTMKFEAEFSTRGMSPTACQERITRLARELRQQAGQRAGELLARQGYFNGATFCTVHHDGHVCSVEVELAHKTVVAVTDKSPRIKGAGCKSRATTEDVTLRIAVAQPESVTAVRKKVEETYRGFPARYSLRSETPESGETPPDPEREECETWRDKPPML